MNNNLPKFHNLLNQILSNKFANDLINGIPAFHISKGHQENIKPLNNFLNKHNVDLIFTDLNSVKNKIDLKKLSNNPTCIMVGPEGDFSESEREEILSYKGVQAIKINENILRSETAVISAISIINYAIN